MNIAFGQIINTPARSFSVYVCVNECNLCTHMYNVRYLDILNINRYTVFAQNDETKLQ